MPDELPPCCICQEPGELSEIREHALLPDRGFLNRTSFRVTCTFCGAHTEDKAAPGDAVHGLERGLALAKPPLVQWVWLNSSPPPALIHK
jgi:hypothetical protein